MKKIFFVVAMLSVVYDMAAQNIAGILRNVEQNNKELQALKKDTEAQKLEIATQNNLEDPSIEYSPFYAKGISGVASSEMVVKQGFDFPTLYAARSKFGKSRKSVADLQYLTARRDILLSAKQLCLDLILLYQERMMIDVRRKNAEEMLVAFEKKLEEGDANILEVNKVKMERMNMETEVAQNDAEHRTVLETLLALNGNMPLDFDASDGYPENNFSNDYEGLYERALASELMLRSAKAEIQASRQNVNVNRQNWMPKLEFGYRRNTERSDASNGFMVGASFPLFSNRNKLKMAKVRLEESELQFDNARFQMESRLRSLINELKQTRKAAGVYDTELLYGTLGLLRKAVDGGEITVIEYYVEVDEIFKNLQTHLQLVNKSQKLFADITRNEL